MFYELLNQKKMSINDPNHPEKFSNFYKEEKLGFDLKLVEKGYLTFKKYFCQSSC